MEQTNEFKSIYPPRKSPFGKEMVAKASFGETHKNLPYSLNVPKLINRDISYYLITGWRKQEDMGIPQTTPISIGTEMPQTEFGMRQLKIEMRQLKLEIKETEFEIRQLKLEMPQTDFGIQQLKIEMEEAEFKTEQLKFEMKEAEVEMQQLELEMEQTQTIK